MNAHRYLPLLAFVSLIGGVAITRALVELVLHKEATRFKFIGVVLVSLAGTAVLFWLTYFVHTVLLGMGEPETFQRALVTTITFGAYVALYIPSVLLAIGSIGCFFMSAIASRHEVETFW